MIHRLLYFSLFYLILSVFIHLPFLTQAILDEKNIEARIAGFYSKSDPHSDQKKEGIVNKMEKKKTKLHFPPYNLHFRTPYHLHFGNLLHLHRLPYSDEKSKYQLIPLPSIYKEDMSPEELNAYYSLYKKIKNSESIEMIKNFIDEHKINLNVVNAYGETFLHIATKTYPFKQYINLDATPYEPLIKDEKKLEESINYYHSLTQALIEKGANSMIKTYFLEEIPLDHIKSAFEYLNKAMQSAEADINTLKEEIKTGKCSETFKKTTAVILLLKK